MAVSIMAGIPALKEINADLRRRMDGAVATFQANLAATRTGRASVHMLDQVKVDYYGTQTPISQLAQVSAPEAQMILIAPWDPTILKEIEKAVRVADLGFNPSPTARSCASPFRP
jgi:ribosome recycling factor